MNRMTSNNTFDMNMHELALNQVYVGEDGWVRYRSGPEDDLSVCDLIRTAAETLGAELPILNDDGLSDLLAEWLQYGAEEPEGVLAILYRALWAMAEVRAKLSRYEDTGLGPEEITTDPYGCVFYCNRKCNLDGDWCAEGPGCRQEIDAEAAEHLLELAQAEKDGRLVVLPCKVGDMLYEVDLPEYGVITCKVLHIDAYSGPMAHVPGSPMVSAISIGVEVVEGHGKGSSYAFEAEDFGKTVFLTREEAEAALKKRRETVWGLGTKL